MTILEKLNWRYATKQFDNTKKVSWSDKDTLKENIRLSASSYGLLLYKAWIIENNEIKEQLKSVSFGENQTTDASHFFVFYIYITV